MLRRRTDGSPDGITARASVRDLQLGELPGLIIALQLRAADAFYLTSAR